MDHAIAADERLFIYGSLLDGELRKSVIGREVAGIAGILHGYVRRRGRYYYVVPQAGGAVAGLIVTGVGAAGWSALDRYEEVPALYTREIVTVIDGAGAPLACWCYLPTAAVSGP